MVEAVDPRVVANPAQVRQLLTAVTYVGRRNRDRGAPNRVLRGGLLRGGAARGGIGASGTGLRAAGAWLEQLALGEPRPAAGKRWTDSGEVHDRRGRKHRGRNEVRLVQIPPVLVGMLREHLDRFGVGPDGRLFCSPNGGVVSSSTYFRVWDEAREYALSPSQVASPLARRPYDLRHAAVSLWLNRGVPAPEVAQRAGHSVDVLLKVYAKCIEGGPREDQQCGRRRVRRVRELAMEGPGLAPPFAPRPAKPPGRRRDPSACWCRCYPTGLSRFAMVSQTAADNKIFFYRHPSWSTPVLLGSWWCPRQDSNLRHTV